VLDVGTILSVLVEVVDHAVTCFEFQLLDLLLERLHATIVIGLCLLGNLIHLTTAFREVFGLEGLVSDCCWWMGRRHT
jgi:hypothetical protein